MSVDPKMVFYDKGTDILFVSFGPHDLTCLDHEEDMGDGVFLQFAWPGGELAGMEVWGFSERYGSLPATVRLDLPEPVSVRVPREPVSA